MSTTPRSKAAKAPRSSSKAGADSRPFIRATDLPGVYLNADGAQVNEAGVLMSLQAVKAAEADLIEELGEPPQSPAQFLKRVALDPRMPLTTRITTAIAAAPYFDRKMPLGLEGGDPSRPLRTEATSTLLTNLERLTAEERREALAVLERLGILG